LFKYESKKDEKPPALYFSCISSDIYIKISIKFKKYKIPLPFGYYSTEYINQNNCSGGSIF